ncbi:MAG: hypothetical protein OXU51_16700 [Candidatus Poribacteria bacterium]|nr:hypothetical protein [Candidatus Poribacteria bacterium]
MINSLYLAATLQALCTNSAKLDSVFLKLEIVSGDIFQIDDSILQKLCQELKDGVGLTECGRTEDVLPYGSSREAEIENGYLSTIIEVPRGLKFGGQRSYASTDDFIMVFSDGMVRDFSIGLVDVICRCDICNESLSSDYKQCCEHLPGEKDVDRDEIYTYKIKEGRALFISADPFPVTDDDNIQLLLEDWGVDEASLIEAKINELSQSGKRDDLPPELIEKYSGLGLVYTASHPGIRRRTRKFRRRSR